MYGKLSQLAIKWNMVSLIKYMIGVYCGQSYMASVGYGIMIIATNRLLYYFKFLAWRLKSSNYAKTYTYEGSSISS